MYANWSIKNIWIGHVAFLGSYIFLLAIKKYEKT
jgi:hypothetical protein